MTYTAAAIKETLRLWPPAGTLRVTKPGAGIKVQTSIGEFNLEGVDIYNCAFLIHRDPEVYGDTANEYVPERWLPGENSTEYKQIPSSAWRPFERGPRVCMGQDLANLEARVVVALVARRYDFIKVSFVTTTWTHSVKSVRLTFIPNRLVLARLQLTNPVTQLRTGMATVK